MNVIECCRSAGFRGYELRLEFPDGWRRARIQSGRGIFFRRHALDLLKSADGQSQHSKTDNGSKDQSVQHVLSYFFPDGLYVYLRKTKLFVFSGEYRLKSYETMSLTDGLRKAELDAAFD